MAEVGIELKLVHAALKTGAFLVVGLTFSFMHLFLLFQVFLHITICEFEKGKAFG